MSAQMPEYPMLRHYLELIAELPWSTSSQDRIDIAKARADLDSDHHSLSAVKRRILEYLAVRKLNPGLRGPILCFVGPPGVGKTSIGKSIARTLEREFQRISLGGVSDQSDIRGHRRTYIGAMPGRIIQGLKAAGTNNPVFLLDEIDKMTVGIHGDPAAALLEVLDPEQNVNFVDHYLNLPFDLSQVLFIATANSLATLSRPLLDRMEIIPLPGYSQEDKLPIAGSHLLPRQMAQHGIPPTQLQVPEASLKFIISRYTREAGVRGLERQLATLCRAVAVKLAEEADENCGGEKVPVTNMSMDEEQTEDARVLAAKRSELPLVVNEDFIQTVLGSVPDPQDYLVFLCSSFRSVPIPYIFLHQPKIFSVIRFSF
jgi:ATP-dependent Lon protease